MPSSPFNRPAFSIACLPVQPVSRIPALSLAALALGLTLGSSAVSAQTLPSSAIQANPGAVTTPLDPRQEPVYSRQKQAPRIQPDEVKLDAPQPPTAPEPDSEVTFQVKQFDVEGNTVFTLEDLKPLLTPYENRRLTMKDLKALTEDVMRKYSDAGYPTTQVYIPPQDIMGGAVKMRIVEGKIGTIEISGNKYFRAKAIERNLLDKPGELLNIQGLEKNLNQMNRQQPYRVRATLKPGQNTGESDLHLDVEEAQPWQISPTFDNQGRPFIGTNRFGVGVQNNSLLGWGDRLDMRWIAASRTQLATASYYLPLNKYGTELGYFYSFGHVRPEVNVENLGDVKVVGLANNHSVSLSQPLNRSRTLLADVSFNARHITTSVDDERTNRDDVRSLSFGLTYSKPDRYGQSFLRLQSDVGPGWMGANRKFWKTQATGSRVFQLPKNNFLLLRASGQMTSDGLPPVEQYQLGGAFSVRGYTEGLLIGDRGYNTSVEWRWPIPGLSHVSPWLSQRLQGAVFYDMGQVWFDKSNANRRGNQSQYTLLMGTGLGLRAQLTRFMIGFVDFGYGITNQGNVEPNAQPTVRVHFGVRSDLLPKNYASRGNQINFLHPNPTPIPTVKAPR